MNTPLYLVMKLAQCSLREFLQNQERGAIHISLKHQFCRNIAAGIDVLHECGLIHGDPKPDNILVFKDRKDMFVAKVADFGLSIAEVAPDTASPNVGGVGGTFGWQAPEVEQSKMVPRHLWASTDNYSFGLLIWSVLLLNGDAPSKVENTSRILLAREQMEALENQLHRDVGHSLTEAVSKLLHDDPLQRPIHLESLFHKSTDQRLEQSLDLMSLASDDSNMSDFVDYSFNKVHHEGSYYSWETPTMPQVFVRDLYARMMETPDNMDPDMLFAMFLVATAWPKLLETSRNGGLDILLLAAVRGLMAARGVVDCVVKHYGVDLQDEVEAHLPEWRGTAVISGSLLAQRELESHDREVFSQCRKQFHDNGGYATLYGSFETTTKIESTSRGASHSRLHELVTFRTPAAIEAYLQDESDADIDEITSEGETAIYLACARGSWEIFQILLSHGANCRIPCTQWVITCLHWVFAFDEDRQADVVSWLIHNGADPDALTNDATPFPHFPFVLPPGTALHWAVATGSHTMIKLLIQQGFNVLVRDGCDMYVYDERIRILDKFGGPNMEAYSIPRGEVRGLSALDYAAIARDPFIFELIMEQGISIHINDVDEEGLSVLHRLSTDPMRRTRTGNVFADTVFRGEPSKRNENLLRTVQAIVNLGGDLELLTTPSTIISEHNRTELTLPSYTPLMMATLGTSVELVEALLRSGAKVDAVNDKGQTALLCVSEDREAAAMIVPALLSHGENVNHIDNSGSSPIFLAAGPRTLEIVKLLLCKGADIDSRSPNREDEHAQGRSIFSMLPREDEAFNDEADLTIKEMLEKHVFNCPDTIKKQRVIGQEDINGRTLLHHFARSNMPHCVQALLSNNSPVNSVEYIYRRDRDGDAVLKVSWNETPLDSEFVVRERKIKEMQRESVHTLEENEDILSKIDRVIMLLQNAGGTSERSDVKREPFTFDETKYGKRGFVRALREFGVRKQVIDHPQ